MLPLQMLRTGERGTVADVCGDDRVCAQLAERGLRAGCPLEMLAPGNPCLCRIGDTKLSLRCGHCVQVMIDTDAVGAAEALAVCPEPGCDGSHCPYGH